MVHAVLYVSHVLVAHDGFNNDRQWHSWDDRDTQLGHVLASNIRICPNCSEWQCRSKFPHKCVILNACLEEILTLISRCIANRIFLQVKLIAQVATVEVLKSSSLRTCQTDRSHCLRLVQCSVLVQLFAQTHFSQLGYYQPHTNHVTFILDIKYAHCILCTVVILFSLNVFRTLMSRRNCSSKRTLNKCVNARLWDRTTERW